MTLFSVFVYQPVCGPFFLICSLLPSHCPSHSPSVRPSPPPSLPDRPHVLHPYHSRHYLAV